MSKSKLQISNEYQMFKYQIVIPDIHSHIPHFIIVRLLEEGGELFGKLRTGLKLWTSGLRYTSLEE